MGRIVIIGGGAAGMFAAVTAAKAGNEVILLEKNDKLGKKLFITGKGRCNLTNVCDKEAFFQNIVTNGKFLYSALNGLDANQTIGLFEELGLPTKVERGNRVFPVSDHSSDVIKVLSGALTRYGVKLSLHTEITEIITKEGHFSCVKTRSNEMIFGDACIIATGGITYPITGSTGDGYRFAKQIGHKVTECNQALTSFILKEPEVKSLEGLSLKNVRITLTHDKKEIYTDFGEMLFTARGVSGPIILSASSYVAKKLVQKSGTFLLHIDLKPALTMEQLEQRILKDFVEIKNKLYKNALTNLLPQRLIDVIIYRSGIISDKQVNTITKEERTKLCHLLKDVTFCVEGLGSYAESVITQGGVCVREINPTTMESKLVKGVYFIGEVLDIDALTGGFNLQLAWSTAYAAATHIG